MGDLNWMRLPLQHLLLLALARPLHPSEDETPGNVHPALKNVHLALKNVHPALKPKLRKVFTEVNIKRGGRTGEGVPATENDHKNDSLGSDGNKPSSGSGFLATVGKIVGNVFLTAGVTLMSEGMVMDYWEMVKSRHIHKKINSTNNTNISINSTKLVPLLPNVTTNSRNNRTNNSTNISTKLVPLPPNVTTNSTNNSTNISSLISSRATPLPILSPLRMPRRGSSLRSEKILG